MTGNTAIRLPRLPRSVRTGKWPLAAGQAAQAPSAHDAAKAAQSAAILQAQMQKLAMTMQALQSAVAQLHETQREILANAQEQLLELAIDIARKAMMQEIQAGKHQIEPLLKEALLRVPSRQDVVVYLHPDDLERCPMAQAPEQAQNMALRFVADPMVQPGQCLVETAQGGVISSFEDRLEDIADALKSPEQE